MPQCQTADPYGWQSCIEQIKAARYIASVPDGRLYGWQSCVDQNMAARYTAFGLLKQTACIPTGVQLPSPNTSGQAVAEAAL